MSTIKYKTIKVSYEPRLELFARRKSSGWDSIGNEINGNQGIINV